MNASHGINAPSVAELGGKSRPALSRMLFHRCSFDEYGDRSAYEKALNMCTIHFASFINMAKWKITLDIRTDGKEVLALMYKRPLEEGNLYEIVEVWEGDKFLPPFAYD
jgi:hypothetical protein